MENKHLLTDQQIATILNEQLDENYWISQLGQETSEDFPKADNDLSFNFYEKGEELWAKYKPLLKEILCNKDSGTIKSTIDEGLLGNVREFVLYICFELTNVHNIALGISIPLIAIVLKSQLQNFCSN